MALKRKCLVRSLTIFKLKYKTICDKFFKKNPWHKLRENFWFVDARELGMKSFMKEVAFKTALKYR